MLLLRFKRALSKAPIKSCGLSESDFEAPRGVVDFNSFLQMIALQSVLRLEEGIILAKYTAQVFATPSA
eukprot:m.48118 g.48118  ORF g.48118 m.48118 type:complete len:69 (-) comp11971_c1_seq1:246-452(-)